MADNKLNGGEMREKKTRPELLGMIERELEKVDEEWLQTAVFVIEPAAPATRTNGSNWAVRVESGCSDECQASLAIVVARLQKMYSLA